jgi:hypothetical protein
MLSVSEQIAHVGVDLARAMSQCTGCDCITMSGLVEQDDLNGRDVFHCLANWVEAVGD